MTYGEEIADASVNMTLPELAKFIDLHLVEAEIAGQNIILDRVREVLNEKPLTVQKILFAVAGRNA